MRTRSWFGALLLTFAGLFPGAAPATAVAPALTGTQAGHHADEAERYPHLAGQRIQAPGGPKIYLIDPEGRLRWIPDPTTFDNLFRNWDGVLQDPHIYRIEEGTPLTPGAVLAKTADSPKVYLVSNQIKRWIVSPDVFDRNNFNAKRIQTLSSALLDQFPEGDPWTGPTHP